jgi:hypothetical protein
VRGIRNGSRPRQRYEITGAGLDALEGVARSLAQLVWRAAERNLILDGRGGPGMTDRPYRLLLLLYPPGVQASIRSPDADLVNRDWQTSATPESDLRFVEPRDRVLKATFVD